MARVDIHDFDVNDFVKVLDSCEGDVYMVTPEGDRLNLKSKLCQLIGFTALIEGGRVTASTLECSSQEDASKLFRFNLFGEVTRS